MDTMLAIATAVLTDAIRRKVVWVVVIFAAILSFVAPSLPSYGAGVVGSVYREVAISLLFAAALVVTLGLASTRIPAETERRTVYNILSRDVRRWQYLVGTWLGLCGVVGAVIAAFTVVAVAVGGIAYRETMWILFEAAFAVWLEMGVIAAITILLSARFGPVTNVVGALTFVFAGHSVGGLIGGVHGEPPWWLPSLDVFNVIAPVAHGSGYGIGYAAGMVGAFGALSGLLLLGATALFERRDL